MRLAFIAAALNHRGSVPAGLSARAVAWAGLVPFHAQVGDPQAAPDLRAGIPVPVSVCAMTQRRPQRRGPAGPDRVKELTARQ